MTRTCGARPLRGPRRRRTAITSRRAGAHTGRARSRFAVTPLTNAFARPRARCSRSWTDVPIGSGGTTFAHTLAPEDLARVDRFLVFWAMLEEQPALRLTGDACVVTSLLGEIGVPPDRVEQLTGSDRDHIALALYPDPAYHGPPGPRVCTDTTIQLTGPVQLHGQRGRRARRHERGHRARDRRDDRARSEAAHRRAGARRDRRARRHAGPGARRRRPRRADRRRARPPRRSPRPGSGRCRSQRATATACSIPSPSRAARASMHRPASKQVTFAIH